MAVKCPVSVVVPSYNAASTLGRCLVSAITQTVPPAEIIVIDDGSDDPTAIEEVVDNVRQRGVDGTELRLVRLAYNRGPGAARNAGWEEARQPYLAFLDSDDSWHPKKLEIQLNYMLSRPDVAFSGHRWRLWSEALRNGESLEVMSARVLRAEAVLLRNPISTPTVMLRRDVPFRFPERRFSEDYELWLRLLLAGFRGVLLEVPLAYLHKEPYGVGGLSGKLWSMELGELETYWRLFRRGELTAMWFPVCVSWSLAKFIRRAVISAVRRVGR